jgi:hypothetical protein
VFCILVCVCVGFSLSSGDAVDDRQLEVQALSVGFRTGAHHRCSGMKKGFTFRVR